MKLKLYAFLLMLLSVLSIPAGHALPSDVASFKISTENPTPVNTTQQIYPVKFYVKNEGGYSAWFRISWVYATTGKADKYDSHNLLIDQKWEYTLPFDATQITFEGYTNTGILWDKYRQIFSLKYDDFDPESLYFLDGAITYGVKTFGTTFAPKYSAIRPDGAIPHTAQQALVPPTTCFSLNPAEKTNSDTSNTYEYYYVNECAYNVLNTMEFEQSPFQKEFDQQVFPGGTRASFFTNYPMLSHAPYKANNFINFLLTSGMVRTYDANASKFDVPKLSILTFDLMSGWNVHFTDENHFTGKVLSFPEGINAFTHNPTEITPYSFFLTPSDLPLSSPVGLRLYSDFNLSGAQANYIQEGAYPSLHSQSFHQVTSSFVLQPTWHATFFDNVNFTGLSQSFFGPEQLSFNTIYLNWNKKPASLILKKSMVPADTALITYSEQGYSGFKNNWYQEISVSDATSTRYELGSFDLQTGWMLSLYNETDFKGEPLIFRGPTSVTLGLYDRVKTTKSFKLQIDNQNINYPVELYSSEPRTDVFVPFSEAQNIPDLSTYNMDKNISSLTVQQNWKVTFYPELNYQGAAVVYEGPGTFRLISTPNDKIFRSAQIEQISDELKSSSQTDEPILRIYEYANYQGRYQDLNQSTPFLEDMNDAISSFIVQAGYKVRFYQDANYQGGYYTRDSKSSDSKNARDFDNIISSIKIVKEHEQF